MKQFFNPGWVMFLGGLLGVVSCSSGYGGVTKKVSAGLYGEAVLMAEDNRKQQERLAALILGEAITTDRQHSLDYLLLLRSNREHGQKVLRDISRDNSDKKAAELATVALATARRVSSKNATRWLRSEQTDIRTLTLAAMAPRLSDAELSAMTLDIAPEVRLEAVRALCSRKSTSSRAAVLKDALRRDPDPSVRSTVVRCENPFGEDSLDVLSAMFEDEVPAVQEAVIRGIGQVDTAAATALLLRLSSGTMSPNSVLASVELTLRGDSQGEARFRQALKGNDVVIRATALAHLARLKLADARDIRVLALSDPEPQVQFLAAQALLTEDRNRGSALKVLKTLRDGSSPWAEPALRTLARSGDPDAVQTLRDRTLRLSGVDPQMLAAQISACADIDLLVEDWITLMGHEDPLVRTAAAFALLSRN